MSQRNPICRTAVSSGLIVLLARIVDRQGRTLRPDDIAAIEYSISAIDPCRPGDSAADQASRPLEVGDVISEALQNDELWTVDGVGYNFRHEVALSDRIPRFDGQYEVRYVITPIVGERTTVRFHLKTV